MKRLLAAILIGFTALSPQAGPNHGHYHGHRHGHNPGWWVAPAVIGGVVTYALTRPQPVIVQQPPVVYYPSSLPPAPIGFHYEQLLDANCNCYRWVLVSN